MVTVDRVRYLFSANFEAGKLTRLVTVGGRGGCYAGTVAGTLDKRGYQTVMIDRHRYFVHRIIWLLAFGRWPNGEIDHINGNPYDNRLVNLREATRSQNEANKRAPANNTSGFKGVSWWKARKTWRADIRVFGKKKHLGCFHTLELAYAAYCNAAALHHGEFARAE